MQMTTRNATLPDLLTMLTEQHARKIDVVAPAANITARDGNLQLTGTPPIITEDGVTDADGSYTPTVVCDEGVADKLGVPVAYLKRLREARPDLWDANVNGWLHGRKARIRVQGETVDTTYSGEGFQVLREAIPGDPRAFLVRCFRGDDETQGVARAFLSDRYAVVDNFDVLMATLDGVRSAGVQVEVRGGDITDRRMVVRVACPEVQALAPELLRGYRSPFTGASGEDNPVVFAGFQISNSETGGGAFTIVPRLEVQVCSNGMTITRDAMRAVHLGGRLETGVVNWAEDTQQKALELVQAKTRDAVAAFLSADYLTSAVASLEARASEAVATVDAVRDLTKPLGYTQDQVDGILAHFVQGGQMTRGGVVNAITSYAQTVGDGDDAYTLESKATTLLGV